MFYFYIYIVLFQKVLFKVHGLAESKCTDDNILLLNITMKDTNAVLKCWTRPASTEPLKLLLLIHWRVGPKEMFFLDPNSKLAYNDENNVIASGNNNSMTYVSHLHYKVGFQGETQTEDGLRAQIELTFPYNIDMENSLFICFTACADGTNFTRKTVYLTSAHRECNRDRYNLEYPCKFSDYRLMNFDNTCLKVMQDPLSWDMAKANCRYGHRGNLIRIDDRQMDKNISELFYGIKDIHTVWIGLHNRELEKPGQSDYSWLDDVVSAVYFNWLSANLPKRPYGCVLKNVHNRFWYVTSCFGNYFASICQKDSARNPGSPTLKVAFASGLDAAFVGDELIANCSTFAPIHAVIKFRFFNSRGFSDISERNTQTGTSFSWEENGKFVAIGDRCFPRFTAILRMTLTPQMSRSRLACCWLRDDNYTSCSSIIAIKLFYPAQIPLLTIDGSYTLIPYEFLVATCFVCVGTSGQQRWTLITIEQLMVWTSRFNDTEEFFDHVNNKTSEDVLNEDGETSIVWIVNLATECGPLIQSTFRRRVALGLHGSVLLCGAVNLNRHHFFQTSDSTARSSVFTVLGQEFVVKPGNNYITVALAVLLALIVLLVTYMTWGSTCSSLAKDKKKRTKPNRPQAGRPLKRHAKMSRATFDTYRVGRDSGTYSQPDDYSQYDPNEIDEDRSDEV